MNFDNVLFELAGKEITIGILLVLGVIALALAVVYLLVRFKYLPAFCERNKISTSWRKRISISTGVISLTLFSIALVWQVDLNYSLQITENLQISVLRILEILLVLELAQFLDMTINRSVISSQSNREKESEQVQLLEDHDKQGTSISRSIQWALYILAIIVILRSLNVDPFLFDVPGGKDNAQIDFTLTDIFYAVLLIMIARIFSWFITQVLLFRYYHARSVDPGARFAINQIIRYFIYVVAVLIVLQNWGFNLTVILGGIAALLVGIGLGLQETFNDLMSGLVLLFERSIEVGDVIETNNDVGIVRKIGVRASTVETRDNIFMIVPNSKLVHSPIVNWSEMDQKARFNVEVGVAYGSDTQLVKKLLLKAADNCPYVLKYPQPLVMFKNFGDSSLVFHLYFWSRNFLIIENVKSDIRFDIDRLFREHGVRIPFPQRDVHLYKGDSDVSDQLTSDK
jgi:small-conductance mechanosensitive channel